MFKGEISVKELLWELPYKRVLEIIEARQNRLIEEEKALAEQSKRQERENIRNSIISP